MHNTLCIHVHVGGPRTCEDTRTFNVVGRGCSRSSKLTSMSPRSVTHVTPSSVVKVALCGVQDQWMLITSILAQVVGGVVR